MSKSQFNLEERIKKDESIMRAHDIVEEWKKKRNGDERPCSFESPILKNSILDKISGNETYKCPCCGNKLNIIETKEDKSRVNERGIWTTKEYKCKKCGYYK